MAINAGVIGIGMMGGMHLGVYATTDGVEPVAIADVDPKKLKGQFSGGNIDNPNLKEIDFKSLKGYEDAMDLINDPDIDLVDITLPTHLHAKYAVAALEAGKHVMCEKPLARNQAECQKICDAARKSRSVFMVGHCMRFWPEYVFLKDVIDKKIYGKVITANFTRCSPTPTWSWENWLMDPRKSGGMLLDLHIHDIDVVTYLFGTPKAVLSTGLRNKTGVFHVSTQYTYNKSSHIEAEGGWHYHPAFPFRMYFRVVCEEATLEMDTRESPALKVYDSSGKMEEPKVMAQDGYRREIEYMLECIKHNSKPKTITPRIASENVRIALAEMQSVKTGKPVMLKKK